jgi:hypothetical protein
MRERAKMNNVYHRPIGDSGNTGWSCSSAKRSGQCCSIQVSSE